MQAPDYLETQHYMEAMSDVPKKRGRDDEQELSLSHFSFCEHRNKRIHSLPVRTSPRPTQQGLPAANVTPLNAIPGELRRTHIDPSSSTTLSEENPSNHDMDMDMSADPTMPSRYPAHLEPEVDPSSRMPTPIQPSFAAQVRGQQHEWAGNGLHPDPTIDHTVPRTMATDGDWQTVQNNRRLPSPISECEDAMSSSTGQCPSVHAMEHPNAMMDVESRGAAQSSSEAEGSSPGPSPERRGHMRSKHTINTWTWQPGMKKSFSIGYRADCEKCRLKVPGHFNHIVIS